MEAKSATIDIIDTAETDEAIDAIPQNATRLVGGVACAGCMRGSCMGCPLILSGAEWDAKFGESLDGSRKADENDLSEVYGIENIGEVSLDEPKTPEKLELPSYKELLSDDAVPIVLARSRKAKKNEQLDSSDALPAVSSFNADGEILPSVEPEKPVKSVIAIEKSDEKVEISDTSSIEPLSVETNEETVASAKPQDIDSSKVEAIIPNKPEVVETPARPAKKVAKPKKQTVKTRKSPTKAAKKAKNEAVLSPKLEKKAAAARDIEKITVEPKPIEISRDPIEMTSEETETEISVEPETIIQKKREIVIDLEEETIIQIDHAIKADIESVKLDEPSVKQDETETKPANVTIENKASENLRFKSAENDSDEKSEEIMAAEPVTEQLDLNEKPKHRHARRVIKPENEDLIDEPEDDDETPDDFSSADLTLSSVVSNDVVGSQLIYRLGLVALRVA